MTGSTLDFLNEHKINEISLNKKFPVKIDKMTR